jgi:hypothetical protein
MPTIQERIQRRSQQSFVGRTSELSTLWQAVQEDGPLATFISGIGGIGKSTLLHAFVQQLRAESIPVIQIDCRTVPPTEEGVLQVLEHGSNQFFATVTELRPVLTALGQRVVITLDTYEQFRLLDTWLRQVFVPALPDQVRLFCAGREPPVSAWFTTPGWQGLCQHITLGSLEPEAATVLLQKAAVAPDSIASLCRFAKGHPLALALAAAAWKERPSLTLADLESGPVIAELARLYLQEVRDPATRPGLEAASVVRRATRSLLAAMLPEQADLDLGDRLLQLPFVEMSRDGLIVHDLVRQAICSSLQATAPEQYHRYRSRAWQHLRTEWEWAAQHHRWRYAADMIFLIEHPMVRDAFFPPGAHTLTLEPARSEDGVMIRAITHRHEGAEAANLLWDWWQQVPETFRVARDAQNQVVGFYQVFDPAQIPTALLLADPIARRWWQILEADPIPGGQRVFCIRRALGAATGEALSQIQAACWLDAKRMYLEHLETLRRVYIVFRSVDEQGPVVERLGFRSLGEGIPVAGQVYYSYQLDFGEQQVMGWLAGLVDAQYGGSDATPDTADRPSAFDAIFDVEGRALRIAGDRISLTPLEYGVLNYLFTHPGQAVSRLTLLEEVWGYDYEGGSNVVDSIVRSLRKKLRHHGKAIATITGVGYRLDKEEANPRC